MEPSTPLISASTEEPFDPSLPTVALDNAPATLARTALPIVVLSEDPVLLEAMTCAALDQAALIISPSADRFVDQLVATGAELALIDAAAAPPGVAEFLTSLHRQFPQLQLLLAGPGIVQHEIATQIADGTVFRFAHKPASAQRLKLFMDAALRQRQTRITEQILSAPLPAGNITADSHSSAGRAWWMIASSIAVTLLAVGAALAWYISSPGPRPTAGAMASLPAKAPASLRAAAASKAMAALNPTAIAALASQREAEQESIDHAAALRAEQDRITAEEEARLTATVEQARRASEALIGSFRKSLAAGDSAGAEHWLNVSRDYQVSETTLDQMRIQLRGFEAAQSAQVTATQALAEVDAVAPERTLAVTGAPVSAVPAAFAATTSQIVPEDTLRRVNFVPPIYPHDALVARQVGTVDLDFTVTPEGTVTEVKVTAADPVGVFEQAAISALLRSRYQPVERDGVAVAQRAHLRMRFEL